jgi:hypothetical protein
LKDEKSLEVIDLRHERQPRLSEAGSDFTSKSELPDLKKRRFLLPTTKTDLLRSSPVISEFLASIQRPSPSYLPALGWYLAFRNQHTDTQITADDIVKDIDAEVRGDQVSMTWRKRVEQFEIWLRDVNSVQYGRKHDAGLGRLTFNKPMLSVPTIVGYVRYVGKFHRYWEKRLREGNTRFASL